MTKKFTILIASLSFLFLKIMPVSSQAACGDPTDPLCVNIPTPATGVTNLSSLISAGISAAILVAGLLTFVFLVWGGLQWLTSGGDKSKYEAARDRITAALIGLAIVVLAWVLMTVVGKFFGINIFSFTIPSATTPAPVPPTTGF